MKLPFAVYTARDGYAWQSGTEAGLSKLERLRKAIGKMPEFDFGDPASSGMLTVGDDVVLYRFMRQLKADSHGRDALYIAMTYFPRNEARFINADEVLSATPFAEPLRDPPSWFEYNGSPAIPSGFSVPGVSSSGVFDPAGSLASAGFVCSKGCVGVLHISRNEPQDGRGAVFQYNLPKPQHQKATVSKPIAACPQPIITDAKTSYSSAWKWAAIGIGLLAILEAMALIYFVLERSGTETPQNISSLEISPASEPDQPSGSTLLEIDPEQEDPGEPAANVEVSTDSSLDKPPGKEIPSAVTLGMNAIPTPTAIEMEVPAESVAPQIEAEPESILPPAAFPSAFPEDMPPVEQAPVKQEIPHD